MHRGKLFAPEICFREPYLTLLIGESLFRNFPPHCQWRLITSDQLILTRLWTDMGLSLPMDHHLRWARNADYAAKPDIMSCPRHWVTVLDGAPAVNSVRQQLILGSHSWGGAQV